MAEIAPARIESISDSGSGPREEPARKPSAKAAATGKPISPLTPAISAAEEEEKHELDEMA